MKITFLDSDTIGKDISFKKIDILGDTYKFKNTSPEQVAERIAESEVVIVNKLRLFESNLSNARNLRLICVTATGYDNIDLDYCRKNNIAVCNIVGYSSHSVAEVTVAMVLYLATHLNEYVKYTSSGLYTESGVANRLTPTFCELHGKTWGIIGYGNIGREVSGIAEAFGCKTLKYRKTKCQDCVALDAVLSESDVISIHLPLNEETRGLIGENEINKMKSGVILVNTSRGAVTDEKALADAVIQKKIGALGVDVYSREPFGKNHPIYKIKDFSNVCLTPHMAWGAFEARERCVNEVAENIKAFYSGRIRNRVDLK